MKAFILGLTIALALGLWGYVVVNESKPPQAPTAAAKPPDEGLLAWEFTKTGITEMLKSPATAQFSDPQDKQRSSWQQTPAGTWFVQGHVDSQNGFGALIRNRWKGEIKKVDSGFKAMSLQLGSTFYDFERDAHYEVDENGRMVQP